MGGYVKMKTLQELLAARQIDKGGAVQQFIDSEVLRRCSPLVPKDTSELIRSGTRETRLGSGEVIYSTPYARRWYYIPANFTGAPNRGNYWFERMKRNGGKEAILRGAAKLAGGKYK